MNQKLSTEYIINHVFLPPRLPQAGDPSTENDLALLDLVIRHAKDFAGTMSSDAFDWGPIIKMLENLRIIYSVSALDKFFLQDLFSKLTEGGTIVVPVRAQNACVIIRQLDAKNIYEFFEIDPPNEQVMAATGRLIRTFPGPALEIAQTTASLPFREEIMTFLADMDVVTVGSAPSTKKAKSEVFEAWETADPHYITQLLTSIIYGAPESEPADVERIEKRIRNEILFESGASMPWRRSSLWLIIRVALQTTLLRASSSNGQTEYKVFMLSLMADFVLSINDYHDLSNDILVCFQNKIVRRLGKLSDAALILEKATEAINKAREVLEKRWKYIRSQQALSPPWSPESLDLSHDTNISLLSSKDYLYSRLHQTASSATKFIFQPSETPRLNDEDFLEPGVVLTALSDAQSKQHDFKVDIYGSSYHAFSCFKCSLEHQASGLTINVHEWPLPQNELSAQATVFELQCPPVFQVWRSTTYAILNDMCDSEIFGNEKTLAAAIELASYQGLWKYCKQQRRITYASTTMPFTQTHHSTQKISDIINNPSSIFVNNGLHYGLYDKKLYEWAKPSFLNSTVDSLCRFILPSSSPYNVLQYALEETTHSANQPIADQAEIPSELSIHEYIGFGTLRCGAMLQWLNILRELRAQTLSFDCIEVHMLIAQASLQTGTIKHGKLEWHEILEQPDFGLALLSEIGNLLLSIESNWHHIVTLQTLIILTTRLLSSSSEEEASKHAFLILQNARMIAFKWMNNLIEDLEHTNNENSSILMQKHVYLAAATCRATYDVDAHHFSHLIASDEDIKIFIQCAIQIRDNTFENNNELFLARDRRLSYKVASRIWAKIRNNRAGLDKAIFHIWTAYKYGSNWKPLSIPNERWLTSTILNSSPSTQSITLHYNLLDGTLLIDGKPLSRLPSMIMNHPTYLRLLGHVSEY
ncbi:hypothetical protein C0992_001000 [Termitomyces sp. T32_za158]|nr:hypothetical protein C0992_001000 [Termitomyces sp. T32_za158]